MDRLIAANDGVEVNSVTPDSSIQKRSVKNELIKVDESQFVTLSQV